MGAKEVVAALADVVVGVAHRQDFAGWNIHNSRSVVWITEYLASVSSMPNLRQIFRVTYGSPRRS